MPVASKVGNLLSKFWHARPLGSRIIRYVRDGRINRRTDGRTKATLPYGSGGIIKTMYTNENNMCSERSNSTKTAALSERSVVAPSLLSENISYLRSGNVIVDPDQHQNLISSALPLCRR